MQAWRDEWFPDAPAMPMMPMEQMMAMMGEMMGEMMGGMMGTPGAMPGPGGMDMGMMMDMEQLIKRSSAPRKASIWPSSTPWFRTTRART